MSQVPGNLWSFYISVAIALGVILVALGLALVANQRRLRQMQRRYSRDLIAAHEEERAFVAREVHDDALQRVALLHHELQDWVGEGAIRTSERQVLRVKALEQEVEDLAHMLRRVAHRLHPSLLDHAGLVAALESLAGDATRGLGLHVHTDFQRPYPDDLDREVALNLYRIAQESFRNVSKHANSKEVWLSLSYDLSNLTLEIADKGVGFEPANGGKGGLGLRSMQERAHLAGGKVEVRSSGGEGTAIRVTVPYSRPSDLKGQAT